MFVERQTEWIQWCALKLSVYPRAVKLHLIASLVMLSISGGIWGGGAYLGVCPWTESILRCAQVGGTFREEGRKSGDTSSSQAGCTRAVSPTSTTAVLFMYNYSSHSPAAGLNCSAERSVVVLARDTRHRISSSNVGYNQQHTPSLAGSPDARLSFLDCSQSERLQVWIRGSEFKNFEILWALFFFFKNI